MANILSSSVEEVLDNKPLIYPRKALIKSFALLLSSKVEEEVLQMIDLNYKSAFEFTKMIKEKYATLICSLQLSSAQRLILNHEQSLILKMQYKGVLEEAKSKRLIDIKEEKMKKKS